MPTIPIVLMNLIEQPWQVTQIQINRHIFPCIVDKTRNFTLCPKMVLNDVPVTQILNVPISVYETIQEGHVGCELLSETATVALLKRHAV